jgi:hypothetical protein
VANAAQRCPTLAAKNVTPHVLRHYVDGWVMWPARCFRWRGCRAGRFRPHNPGSRGSTPRFA